ncbi:MAG: CPBP family intramembrane glutamic endopeptidase [Betaproteobacteria bacterium]
MSIEGNVCALPPAERPSAYWRLPGTILWGIGAGLVFIVVQVVVTLFIVIRGQHDVSEQSILGLLESAQNNGFVLSVVTIATTLVCLPLVAGIAGLKKGSRIRDYFALRPVPAGSLMRWLGILIVFLVLSDAVTALLGKSVVPEFMSTAYNSSHPRWLLWLALVVAAPLLEETFFRGFLFKGLASSFIGPVGTIALTSALWAAIHVQYDLYGITTIYLLGALLGLARFLTRSLSVPLTLHATANFLACVEAAFLGQV